jgi:hypothetical protein
MSGVDVTLPYLGQGDIALAKSMARHRAGSWEQLQRRLLATRLLEALRCVLEESLSAAPRSSITPLSREWQS